MGLRNALTEVVACFPVYRTYVNPRDASAVDRDYIRWAVAQARKRSPAADRFTFDFIHRILSLEDLDHYPLGLHAKLIQFVRSFQQYTSPVMAKGLEDTAFYRYNRRMDNIYRPIFGGYQCGDVDHDGHPSIVDAIALIHYIFAGGPAPDPYETGDTNCDGIANITDAVYLVTYIFAGGNPPCDTNGDGEPDC